MRHRGEEWNRHSQEKCQAIGPVGDLKAEENRHDAKEERDPVHQDPEQPGVALVAHINETTCLAVVVRGDPPNEQRTTAAMRTPSSGATPQGTANRGLGVGLVHRRHDLEPYKASITAPTATSTTLIARVIK